MYLETSSELPQIGSKSESLDDATKFPHEIIFSFQDVFVFLFSSLHGGPIFTSVSLMVLDLWHFLFIRDLSRNLEIEKT